MVANTFLIAPLMTDLTRVLKSVSLACAVPVSVPRRSFKCQMSWMDHAKVCTVWIHDYATKKLQPPLSNVY